MKKELERDIARVMETDPECLPLLPELLADLTELGGSARAVVSALRSLGVGPGGRALDLGCGKGAVSVALARDLGLRVDGVDGFAPFVASARELARVRGAVDRCTFREADIREILQEEADYDVVLLLSLGPILGDHARTVARLRLLVRAAGYIVIDDAFLAPGLERLEGYAGYATREGTVAALESHGDRLVHEIVWSNEETKELNRRSTDLIRARGEALKAKRPETSALVDRYVESQERESAVLGTDLVCAMWVLERGRGAQSSGIV